MLREVDAWAFHGHREKPTTNNTGTQRLCETFEMARVELNTMQEPELLTGRSEVKPHSSQMIWFDSTPATG